MPEVLRMKQILAASWEGRTGLNSSIVGLSEDGRVYKYSTTNQAWMPMAMVVGTPQQSSREEPF